MPPVNVKDDVVREDLADHKANIGDVHPEFVKKDSGEYLDETPAGTIDGVNTTFTLSAPVIKETLQLIDTDFPWPLFRVASSPGAGEYTYDDDVTLVLGAAPGVGHRVHAKAIKTQQ